MGHQLCQTHGVQKTAGHTGCKRFAAAGQYWQASPEDVTGGGSLIEGTAANPETGRQATEASNWASM
jgi:hypothetical protein